MILDLKKLDILKQEIITAKDFKQPFNYFFDNFAENDQFLNIGKRVKYPELAKVLETISQRLLQKLNLRITNVLLIELAKQKFYHGTFFIDNRLANFIFFKDIDKGMIAISPLPRSSEVLFGRFSFLEMKNVDPNISQSSLN
ncbi:MAG: Uncharacterized protein FD167_1991 [bacterium]|nr:MAG: Uncharacterized protein FD167_1991 [bacterium]